MAEDRRKRILHIKYVLSYDGASLVEYSFARALKDSYVFDWLVFESEGNDIALIFEELGSKIHVFDHKRRNNKVLNRITELKDLRRFFREHPYDVIHIDTDTLRMDGVLYCAKKEGVRKRIIHSHNTKIGNVRKGFDRFEFVRKIRRHLISKWGTDFLACSKIAAEWLFPLNFVRNNKVVIVKNGIDGNRFLFDENIRQNTRRELGISDNDKLLGHIGRFDAQKNHSFIIEVFKCALDIAPNLKLLLIGDGNLKEAVVAKMQELKIADNVILIDKTDKVEDYLFAMDVFLFPSIYEGLGIAAVEAQASGLNTLLSNHVPIEAKISSLAEYLPIDNPMLWAERIVSLENNNSSARISANEEFRNSGFDIKDAAEMLRIVYGD